MPMAGEVVAHELWTNVIAFGCGAVAADFVYLLIDYIRVITCCRVGEGVAGGRNRCW